MGEPAPPHWYSGHVASQAAEQIIAGVVLSERLAVTMYGAIHRAQFNGQRNLRGLVVDPRMLGEPSFRTALTDPQIVEGAIGLSHPCIVPTVGVEQGGPDVVLVTRGVGRYVTVQDLIATARATRGQGGKLALPVAAAIGKSVVEALAVAHRAGMVHGAVHPRSVLLDEDGAIRLGDFVVGRALTTAVAQGADSSMWRGLSGFLAPELVVGEDPSPAADVFAVGALLFTMLSGEVPPGTLHVTPAVERLVQRALDTDMSRRYKHASDLLENLLEAFEDDRWEIADRGEVIRAAGLSRSDTNIDEATEDLLASLGSMPGAVQVTPIRPSMDMRAEVAAARQGRSPTTGVGKLDALLADLDDGRELTRVDDISFKRDPISELIQRDPRKREAIVQVKARVPSLDDPDDDTPIPAPRTGSEPDLRGVGSRPNTYDEHAAMDALSGLDEPVRRVSTAADAASAAADRLEAAAARAEQAASRVDTSNDEIAEKQAVRRSMPMAVAKPNLAELPSFEELPTPRLKSRALGIISLVVVLGGGIAFYKIYSDQQDKAAEQKQKDEKARLDADERTRQATKMQKDRGTISVTAEPPDASIWIKLGRTNLDTMPLTSSQMHRIRIELPGYQAVDTEVLAANWTGKDLARKATVNVTLKAAGKDPKTGKSLAEVLPARPPNLALDPTKGFEPGEGPIHIETSPPGAEVWLLIGYPNTGVSFPTIAGRDYELRALSDGKLPGYAQITAEEWRDGGNPNEPIDAAKKKASIEKRIELVPDPDAKPLDPKLKKGK